MKDELERLSRAYGEPAAGFEGVQRRRVRNDRNRRVTTVVVALLVLGLGVLPAVRMFAPRPEVQPAGPSDGTRVPGTDQSWIGFSPLSGGLSVIHPDGTGRRDLSFARLSEAESSDWSPDGQTIAFSSDQGIFTVPGDLSEEPTRIIDFGWEPAWSPDGSKILFFDDVSTKHEGMFVQSLDSPGTDPMPVAPFGDVQSPDWLDENNFVFQRSGDIYQATIMGEDTSFLTIVKNASDPAVSPDGASIAFARERWDDTQGSVSSIWIHDASGERRVTDLPGYAEQPSWSPDGASIVFKLDLPEGDYAMDVQMGAGSIEVVELATGDVHTLVPQTLVVGNDYMCCQMPIWQPAQSAPGEFPRR